MADLHAQDIAGFFEGQRNKSTLHFITCGSVDDGKSTLIGRLLFESNAIFDDQLASLEKDSRHYGTQGEKIDLTLLVDDLQAEREQGITIDVVYRFLPSTSAVSSWPTRLAMSSTPSTWPLGPRRQIWQ
jgi:bifunctional enzyme CysN/CysC